jgi:hypothetical protein
MRELDMDWTTHVPLHTQSKRSAEPHLTKYTAGCSGISALAQHYQLHKQALPPTYGAQHPSSAIGEGTRWLSTTDLQERQRIS